jgi:hypothetical protein
MAYKEATMTETVIQTNTLPEQLIRILQTEYVKVQEENGKIQLIPIKENDPECPLHGMFSDGKISINKYLRRKQIEKELDQ